MKRPIALLAAAALVGGPLAMDGAALAQGRGRGEAQGERGNGRGNEGRQAPPMREAPPPQTYEREEPAPARRGGYLPPAAGGGVVNDLNRYQLRPPPPGYAWVRVNGGFALVSRATGQIFDIVPN